MPRNTPQRIEGPRSAMGLDLPLYQQWWGDDWNVCTGRQGYLSTSPRSAVLTSSTPSQSRRHCRQDRRGAWARNPPSAFDWPMNRAATKDSAPSSAASVTPECGSLSSSTRRATSLPRSPWQPGRRRKKSEHVPRPAATGRPGAALHRQLVAIWGTGPGLQRLAAVNHSIIGLRFMITAFVYFVIGGVLGMLTRVQLATPRAAFMSPETYNQVFTMHGSMMLFPVRHPDGGGHSGLSDPEDSRHPRFRVPAADGLWLLVLLVRRYDPDRARCSPRSRQIAAGSCIRR